MNTVESFTSTAQTNLENATRAVPVPNGHTGVDEEHDEHQATRRQAQRRYRRSVRPEHFKEAQVIH